MNTKNLERVLRCALSVNHIEPNKEGDYVFDIDTVTFTIKPFKHLSKVSFSGVHAEFYLIAYRHAMGGNCAQLSFQRSGQELFCVDLNNA